MLTETAVVEAPSETATAPGMLLSCSDELVVKNFGEGAVARLRLGRFEVANEAAPKLPSIRQFLAWSGLAALDFYGPVKWANAEEGGLQGKNAAADAVRKSYVIVETARYTNA